MVNTRYLRNVKHIQAGEPVSSGVARRPDIGNDVNIRYLKALIEAAGLGSGLFALDVTLSADVQEGDAVYWNNDTQRYERALAQVTHDTATGALVAHASADVVGLVIAKTNSTLGNLALAGIHTISNLANGIIGGVVTPGRYYLSAVEPGKLVKQRPPVSVAVGFVLDATRVIVNPQMRDFLEDHIHHQFTLTAAPAGTHVPPAVDEQHVITDADDTLPGWLPYDHEVFDGLAPAGANFGYNLSAHPELQSLWPPIPPGAAALEILRPSDDPARDGLQRVPPEIVRLDQNGIWWMTNCYGQVPWPTLLDTTQSSSASSESISGEVCPNIPAFRLLLSFIRMTFFNDKSAVTSLEPAEGSPIQVLNCDGDVSRTGALYLALDLNLLIAPDEVYGGSVIKSILSGAQFGAGHVVEGIVAGANIEITSTRSRPVDPDDEDSDTLHQDIVTLDVNLNPVERDLAQEVTRLGDAAERTFQDVMYLGFPPSRDSGIRLRINVPPQGLPAAPTLTMRVLVLGRTTGTLPNLTMSYRRIARPSGSPVALPTTDTALSFTSAVAVSANQYIEASSEAFTIAAGDTVLVSINRASGDGYAGEVGILRIGGVVAAGE